MAEAETARHWSPITDLKQRDHDLDRAELLSLSGVWDDVKSELPTDQVDDFNERLKREWAIETGLIERVYTFDAGITQLLIEQGIDASLIPHDATDKTPQIVAGIIADQAQAVDFLFDFVGQQRCLSESYIKELHALMTRKQAAASGIDQFGRPVEVALSHGEYKLHPNNPTQPDGRIFEYCPPEQVAPEMERLVEMHLDHTEAGVAAELEAAWLHHRFTQIHPFQDGNGRVARALASLVLIREGWFPLVIASADRVRYIDNLKAADAGDLLPLASQFASVQRTWFRKAIGIGEQIRQAAERTDQLIAAIGEQFRERRAQTRVDMEQAKETATTLAQMAWSRFRTLRNDISDAIGADDQARRVFVDYGVDEDTDRRAWHRYQVIETARHASLDYWANARELHSWVRLGLVTESGRSEILFSLHGLNREFRGLVGASMCLYRRQKGDDIEHQIIELEPVCDELFQFNYKEATASVERRFDGWLEESLLRALDQWRRGE
ncbi:Fic family protein [Candidatus Poriferisodalis sp.]|uniref:Fic family protein n=1 Tax=Candidatus Poriferisodalis sp. TaxID=3101277 RepID=UPI003B01E586